MTTFFLTPQQLAARLLALLLLCTSGLLSFGQVGGLSFDGTDDYVNIANEAAFDVTTGLSLEVWVNLNTATGQDKVITKFGEISGNDAFQFAINSGIASFQVKISGAWITCDAVSALSTGQWYHLAGTYDGAALKLYVNGALVNTTTASGSIDNSSSTVKLGTFCNSTGNTPFTAEMFDGIMDEVRIWNIARSGADILAEKDYELVGNESGLIGYWKFNQTSGSTLTATTGGNNGTLTNFAFSGSSNWTTGKALASPAPTITSFSPSTAVPGATVTITGTKFNTTPANNIVYFGATQATVTTASATSLEVTVPVGATHSTLTVLNTATGYSTRSMQMFLPVFSPSVTTNGFDNKLTFATQSGGGRGIAVGDLDGDGKTDVIVCENGASVFRNTSSSGSISFATRQDFTTFAEPQKVVAVDFDNDGKLDIATSTGNLSGLKLSVLRNTSTVGAINFASTQDLPAANNIGSLTSFDYDNDGWQDLIMVTHGNIGIYRNTSTIGSISFATRVDVAFSGNYPKTASGDIDGDGKADLLISANNQVMIMLNTSTALGTISFGTAQTFAVSGADRIAVSDLDGDGKQDVVVLNTAKASVFRNQSTVGNVSLAAIQDFTAGSGPFDLSIADFSGDGKPDLAVANTYDNNIGVYMNTSSVGSISFASGVTMTNGSAYNGLYHMAAADFDGDNRPDIAALNSGGSLGLAIVRNSPPPPGAALNFDGSNDNVGTATVVSTLTNSFTMEAWVNINAYKDAGILYNGNTSGTGYGLYMTSTGALRAFFATNSPYAVPSYTLPLNTWTHIAMVCNANRQATVYVNGVDMGTSSTFTSNTPTGRFSIGSGYNGTPLEYFNGTIDDVRFWSRPLCQSELQAQMNCELSGSESGLVAYYKFNQGAAGVPNTGNTLTNSATTGATNNGTLNNFGLTGTTSNWVATGGVTTGSSCSAFTGGNTVSLSSVAGTDGQTVCQNTAITDITYTTTNATGANVTGLPTGVTGVWAANVVTISGTPSVAGTFNYTVTLTGGCGNVTATGSIVVNPAYTPSVSIASNDADNSICTGTSVTFTATASNVGGGTVIYDFKVGGSSVQNSSSNTYTTTTLANADNVTCEISVSGGTCLTTTTATSNSIVTTVNGAPTFSTCPGNLTPGTNGGACTAVVTYTTATTGSPSVTYAFTGATTGTGSGDGSGSTFNKGTTNVVLTATSGCGSTTCSFTVTVADDDAPTITCAGDVTLSCPGTTTLTAPTVSDNCPSVTNGLHFNGGGQMTAPLPAGFPGGATPKTFECWVYRDNSSNRGIGGVWHDAGASGGSAFGMMIESNKLFWWGHNGDVTLNNVDNTVSIPVGAWAHLAITYDGTTLRGYINGTLVGTSTRTINTATNGPLYLGYILYSSFLGKIDEFRVWNVARTQSEIQGAMNVQLGGTESGLVAYYRLNQGTAGGNNTGQTTVTATTGNNGTLSGLGLNGATSNWVEGVSAITLTNNAPATYPAGVTDVTWTATDGAGNSSTCVQKVTVTDNVNPTAACKSTPISLPLDASGNATLTTVQVDNGSTDNCGTPTLSLSQTAFSCADIGNTNALNFNGSQAVATTVDASSLPLGNSARTFMAWVKQGTNAGAGTGNIVLMGRDDCSGLMFGLGNGNGSKKISFWGGCNDRTSTMTLADGVWTHVAVTYDGAGNITLYKDATTSETFAIGSLNTRVSKVHIGGETTDNGGFYRGYFNGQIDEAQIYNRALSMAEIQTAMNGGAPSGRVFYAPLNEGTGSTTADLQGGLTGSLLGSPTWVSPAPTGLPPTVTLTVTDAAGNSATCNATINVVDNIAPTLSAPSNQTLSADAGTCTVSYTIPDPISDNCGSATWGYILTGATTATVTGIADGSNRAVTFNTGTTTVTLTGTDRYNTATQVPFTVTVNAVDVPAVSIASSDADNTICAGTSVTFTATPTYGGAAPTYQWKKGTDNVGSGGNTYTTTGLANGDQISVVMTSNHACPTTPTATSNSISTMVNTIAVSAGANQTMCASTASVPLSGTYSGSASATWSTSGTGSFVGVGNVVVPVVSGSCCCIEGTYTAGPIYNGAQSWVKGPFYIRWTGTGWILSEDGASPAYLSNAGGSATDLPTNGWMRRAGCGGGSMSLTSGGGPIAPAYSYAPSVADIAAGNVTLTYTTAASGVCPATASNMQLTILDIANASVVTGASQNVAATHECTDGSGWTHYVKMPGNRIVLSLKKNGNTIGSIGDGSFGVTGNTTPGWSNSSAASIVSGTAPYVQNDTWHVMNRWWAVTPNPQPSTPVQVKMYYHADDLSGLRAATSDLALAHTQLKFYKINGSGDPNPANGHSGVNVAANYAAEGYWEYNNSTSGTNTTWLWSDLGTNRYSAEYTVASFSGGGGGGSLGGGNSNSAFPVEWLSFDAERVANGDVVLNWATASEASNAGFEVEQSADGQIFVQIGYVAGAGNSSVRQDYRFQAANAGAAYYRLRQVDTDGKASYSETRYLSADMTQAWYFAPNPVRGTVHLNGVFAPDSYVHTTVHSVDGRLLFEHIGTDAEAALNEALSGFAPGLYLFQLRVEGKKVATQQMVIE